jgi:hypothetical protein
MSVTGQRFLELTRADAFEVTGHALHRLHERTGRWFSEDNAVDLFRRARQVRPDEMIQLGYRPCYGRRLRNGEKSWYFRLTVERKGLIAMVGQDGDHCFAWVTTYGRSAQTDQLCTVPYEALACVA